MVWFGEIQRKLAKLSMTTFNENTHCVHRFSALLFPFICGLPINLSTAEIANCINLAINNLRAVIMDTVFVPVTRH